MRIGVGLALFVAARAQADLSAPAPTRTFPLGQHCAAALEQAVHRAGFGFTAEPILSLEPDGANASFHVSDQCGVGGDAYFDLSRDARPDASWHRIDRVDAGNEHIRLSRRYAGWHARIEIAIEGMEPHGFEAAFRHAADVCLADVRSASSRSPRDRSETPPDAAARPGSPATPPAADRDD